MHTGGGDFAAVAAVISLASQTTLHVNKGVIHFCFSAFLTSLFVAFYVFLDYNILDQLYFDWF